MNMSKEQRSPNERINDFGQAVGLVGGFAVLGASVMMITSGAGESAEHLLPFVESFPGEQLAKGAATVGVPGIGFLFGGHWLSYRNR